MSGSEWEGVGVNGREFEGVEGSESEMGVRGSRREWEGVGGSGREGSGREWE